MMSKIDKVRSINKSTTIIKTKIKMDRWLGDCWSSGVDGVFRRMGKIVISKKI